MTTRHFSFLHLAAIIVVGVIGIEPWWLDVLVFFAAFVLAEFVTARVNKERMWVDL